MLIGIVVMLVLIIFTKMHAFPSLIISAVLIAVLAMPFVVRLLYSAEFAPAVPMAVCTVPYMFFKALTLPAAYLALAHGDSRTFLLTELIYDVFVVAAIPLGFAVWGLAGAGWMLSAGGVVDPCCRCAAWGARPAWQTPCVKNWAAAGKARNRAAALFRGLTGEIGREKIWRLSLLRITL